MAKKLWLAADAPGLLGMNGFHLFCGNSPPTFEHGGSSAGDDCEYLGEVPLSLVRGGCPEPGTCIEAVLLLKGGAS